jgi:hypothetical protein
LFLCFFPISLVLPLHLRPNRTVIHEIARIPDPYKTQSGLRSLEGRYSIHRSARYLRAPAFRSVISSDTNVIPQCGEPELVSTAAMVDKGMASRFSSASSSADRAAIASSSSVVGSSVAWMRARRRAQRCLVSSRYCEIKGHYNGWEKKRRIRVYHFRFRIEGDWAGVEVRKSRERAAPRSTAAVCCCSEPASGDDRRLRARRAGVVNDVRRVQARCVTNSAGKPQIRQHWRPSSVTRHVR